MHIHQDYVWLEGGQGIQGLLAIYRNGDFVVGRIPAADVLDGCPMAQGPQ